MLLASIGPTSNAAEQHSYRVYHAVQSSLGNSLDPEMWGFQQVNGLLMPIAMTKAPAPDYLLNLIRSVRIVELLLG